jgi:hypothetical protein
LLTLPTVSLTVGFTFEMKLNLSNLGPATLDVNGTGARPLRDTDLNPLVADDIEQNSIYLICWNFNIPGGGWQVLGLAKTLDPVTTRTNDFSLSTNFSSVYIPNGDFRVKLYLPNLVPGDWTVGENITDTVSGATGALISRQGPSYTVGFLSAQTLNIDWAFGSSVTNGTVSDIIQGANYLMTIFTTKRLRVIDLQASGNLGFTSSVTSVGNGAGIGSGYNQYCKNDFYCKNTTLQRVNVGTFLSNEYLFYLNF